MTFKRTHSEGGATGCPAWLSPVGTRGCGVWLPPAIGFVWKKRVWFMAGSPNWRSAQCGRVPAVHSKNMARDRFEWRMANSEWRMRRVGRGCVVNRLGVEEGDRHLAGRLLRNRQRGFARSQSPFVDRSLRPASLGRWMRRDAMFMFSGRIIASPMSQRT